MKRLTQEGCIVKFKAKHGNKYDYSKVRYRDSITKVTIICKKHGEFEQRPSHHWGGQGCPKCANEENRLTQEGCIAKFKAKHGNKYNYSKVRYRDNSTKVTIICKKHGEFEQRPEHHWNGHGCPKCSSISTGKARRLTQEECIAKFKAKHGNKYNYSKVRYRDSITKVTIICKKHGEFEQRPANHWKGQGCPKCGSISTGKARRLTQEECIAKFKEVHGDKYDYSKVQYINNRTKVTIICKEHGEFEQHPENHWRGSGCPKCGVLNRVENKFLTQEDCITRFKEVHGDKYDYSKVNYAGTQTKVTITCKKHGEFEQHPEHHWRGSGCPRCVNHISKPEQDIVDWLKTVTTTKIEQSRRDLLGNGKEIDIYLPEFKLGIEYCGEYYHTTQFREKKYHYDKFETAKENNIRLLTVFGTEWQTRQNQLKSIISCAIGKVYRIFARKCTIKEIPSRDGVKFVNENHLQPVYHAKHAFGLFHNDKLISVMLFSKHHRINNNTDILVLSRFCTVTNHIVVGGASKLFKYALKHIDANVSEIISWSDSRYFDGGMYKKLGFVLDKELQPDYKYVRNTEIRSKQSMKKKNIGCPPEKTEEQCANALGWYRIFDCGKVRWIYETTSD